LLLSLLLVFDVDLHVYAYSCNCFHARRADVGKITTFRGVPFFEVRVRRPLWT